MRPRVISRDTGSYVVEGGAPSALRSNGEHIIVMQSNQYTARRRGLEDEGSELRRLPSPRLEANVACVGAGKQGKPHYAGSLAISWQNTGTARYTTYGNMRTILSG